MLNRKNNRLAIYISAGLIVLLVLFAIFRDNAKIITYSEASRLLSSEKVVKVIDTNEYIYLKTKKDIYKISSSQTTPQMFQNYEVTRSNSDVVLYILLLVLTVGAISFAIRYWQKRELHVESAFSSTATSSVESLTNIQPIKSSVKFSDIGGIDDVKVELEEIIDFMKNPKKYENYGARMPKGILLVGPPGVGKTMIAQATAHEADVPFYYQSGASFVQIYVGMGAKRVHELFESAKNSAPSIIFIDEIDAVGKRRDGERNDEREATLNQLLTEMDGFEDSSGVVVLAATNKIDVLDSALLRAGRFDRRIFVELPTKKERQSILAKYLLKVPHQVDVKLIANMTVGFNGASLASLVNESAILSLRQNDTNVTIEHFHQVKDRVMFGKKRLQMLSDQQKQYRITYQAGKVLSATYFDLPFEKLMLSNETLTPNVNEPLIKHELESRVKMHLSGIVACDIKYSEHTSSAKNDLDEAKQLIFKMLNEYGMGQTLTNASGENEVLIQRLYKESKKLLSSLSSVMSKIESILYEKESISKVQVKKFLDEVL